MDMDMGLNPLATGSRPTAAFGSIPTPTKPPNSTRLQSRKGPGLGVEVAIDKVGIENMNEKACARKEKGMT